MSTGGACSVNGDCLAGEFCGEGACRDGRVEEVTYCVEAVWVPGRHDTDGSPPDLAVRMSGEFILDAPDSCNPNARWCRVGTLESFQREVFGIIERDSQITREPYVLLSEQQYLNPAMAAADLADFVGVGCTRMHPTGNFDGDTSMMWASAWYP